MRKFYFFANLGILKSHVDGEGVEEEEITQNDGVDEIRDTTGAEQQLMIEYFTRNIY